MKSEELIGKGRKKQVSECIYECIYTVNAYERMLTLAHPQCSLEFP